MVTFVDGKPSKSNYRRFKIRMVEGIDDYKMIQEVLMRRYKRVMQEGLQRPDLIVIDGGRGHLTRAAECLRRLKLSVPVIAIAKKEELLYTVKKKKPVALSQEDPTLQLIQRVRDEAHRFAITYHTLLRSKQTLNKK